MPQKPFIRVNELPSVGVPTSSFNFIGNTASGETGIIPGGDLFGTIGRLGREIPASEGWSFFDDFEGSALKSTYWTASGSGSLNFYNSSNAAPDAVHQGMWEIGCGPSSFNSIQVTGIPVELGTIGETTLEFSAKLTFSALTNKAFYFGFYDVVAAKVVAFQFDNSSSSGLLYARAVKSGVTTVTSTGLTLNTSWHKYKIVVSADGTATFYVDGTQCAQMSSEYIPTGVSNITNLGAFAFTNTFGSIASSLILDWISVEQIFTTPR